MFHRSATVDQLWYSRSKDTANTCLLWDIGQVIKGQQNVLCSAVIANELNDNTQRVNCFESHTRSGVWISPTSTATYTAYSIAQTCIMILISYRPSDKRSPGKDPRLQYAFENQVLGVSCISHRLTQLAAFFIDQRTEWSTVCSCTAY